MSPQFKTAITRKSSKVSYLRDIIRKQRFRFYNTITLSSIIHL